MISPDQILIVFNPAAQSGRLAKMELDIRSESKKILGRTGFIATNKKGHAREIARTVSPAIKQIISIGGDGTVHEIAAGLTETQSEVGMAVIPLGSGNDFARALHMDMDWRTALNQIKNARLIRSDVGLCQWMEGDQTKKDYFINALGIGFDAYCAHLAPQYKSWPFGLGYTVSILVALRSWISAGATVWDLSEEKKPIFSGKMMFTTVGNAQDSGGGYTINPKALVSDGLLDPCIVEDVSFFKALSLLPSARDGKHIRRPEVHYHQLTKMLVETDRGIPIHADGEVKSLEARSINVEILAGALNVFIPANAPDPI